MCCIGSSIELKGHKIMNPSSVPSPQTTGKYLSLKYQDDSQGDTNAVAKTCQFELYIFQSFSEREPIESKGRAFVKGALQTGCVLAGYGTRLTVMNIPLKFAGANQAYGAALVYGNTASWGSVISWCLLNMTNNLMTPLSKVEERLRKTQISACTKRALIIGSVAIGMLAQVPHAYISYTYNDNNILFPIALILIDSAYPIYSLNLTVEKGIQQRNLSSFENKLLTLKTKLNDSFESNFTSWLKDESSRKSRLNDLRQLNQNSDLASDEKVKKYLSMLLSPVNQIFPAPENCCVKMGRSLANVCGLALAGTQLYFSFTLSYNAAAEIVEEPIGNYAVAGLITACSAYLSFKVLFNSSVKAYDFVVNSLRGQTPPTLASIVNPKLRFCLQLFGLLTVGLSYAIPVQVCDDYYEGDLKSFMQVTSVMETMIISSFAISQLVNEVIAVSGLKSSDCDIKLLVEVHLQLQKLTSLIQASPMVEFAKLIDILPQESAQAWMNELQITNTELQSYITANDILTDV